MNVLNVLMDTYRTSSCSLLQNGRVYCKKHNTTVSNIVCESITYLGVMRANIEMGCRYDIMSCSDWGLIP